MSQSMTKPTKWLLSSVKTHISLGICPVWSESSLSAWRSLGYPSSEQRRLIRLGGPVSFLGAQVILLVLLCSGLYKPHHEKTCLCHMRTTKVHISLRIRTVWSAPLLYNISSFCIRNFKPLASFCGCPGRFESYLVENPKDRFSCDEAHILSKTNPNAKTFWEKITRTVIPCIAKAVD